MKLRLYFPGTPYFRELLPNGCFQKIVIDGVVVLNVFKQHNHSYSFQAFFYSSKHIVSRNTFRSKKELYGAIQFLLQEELNVDV